MACGTKISFLPPIACNAGCSYWKQGVKSLGVAITVVFILLNQYAVLPSAAAADPWRKKYDESVALQKRRQYEEAIKAATEALNIARSRYGEESTQVVSTLGRIANIFSWQRNYPAAKKNAARALDVARRIYGPKDVRTVSYIRSLAWVQSNLKDYEAAESLHREALAILKKERGPEHPDVSSVLMNLAYLDLRRKRYEAAEAAGLRAIEIRKKSFGEDHNYVAESSMFMGRLYAQQKRYAEALAMYEQALKVRSKKYPSGHKRLASLEKTVADLKERMNASPQIRKANKQKTATDSKGDVPAETAQKVTPPRHKTASPQPGKTISQPKKGLTETVSLKVKKWLDEKLEKKSAKTSKDQPRNKANGGIWVALFFLAALVAFFIGFMSSMRSDPPSKRKLTSSRRPALKGRGRSKR